MKRRTALFGRKTLPAALLALAAMTILSGQAPAGTYRDSSHGNANLGVNRSFLDGKYLAYARGNCGHCHEAHASLDGVEPNPVGGAPSSRLTFATEENLCYTCHGSTVGGASTNIQADVAAGATGSRHNPADYTGKHSPKETPAELSANKHVECTDCHNPHMARGTRHLAGANASNAILATSPLYGATGIVTTFNSQWNTSYASSFTQATMEYQICFKCHAGANTNVTSWGGTGSLAWTDAGLEFNTSNASYHPVAGTLLLSKRLKTNQLFNGWTPGRTMYCSDCHQLGTSGTNAGPHGSATRWMLAGTNKAWPYRSAALNGSNSRTRDDYRYLGTAAGNRINANYGTINGLFCLNCHPFTSRLSDLSSGSSMSNGDIENVNKAHGKHVKGTTDRAIACVECHIRVPHGGRVSRLQAADRNLVMPARYAPNGEGQKITGSTWAYRDFRFRSDPTQYSDSDCYGTGNTAWDGCSKHDSTFTGERW